VTDVGVVSAEDERWGETVVAVVSVVPGASLSLDGVRDFGAEQLARFKLPTRLVVTEAVPRNGSGKLDKKALRELVDRR
jgi:fatty-acyl-CoA synthase